MSLFDALGFKWDRERAASTVAASSIEKACFRFQEIQAEFIWDAAVLEGNPLSLSEVESLLQGQEVSGRKISDQEQVLNLAEGCERLLSIVKCGRFFLGKEIFTKLNEVIARHEALEWGVFRGEGSECNYTPAVGLGHMGYYTPAPTEPGAATLNRIFADGISGLSSCAPFERAAAFFLFGALQQFFFDGNKRTSRFMMNGILMSHGIDAISFPAAKLHEFDSKMVRFYLSKDASEMMDFIVACQQETQTMFKRRDLI